MTDYASQQTKIGAVLREIAMHADASEDAEMKTFDPVILAIVGQDERGMTAVLGGGLTPLSPAQLIKLLAQAVVDSADKVGQ